MLTVHVISVDVPAYSSAILKMQSKTRSLAVLVTIVISAVVIGGVAGIKPCTWLTTPGTFVSLQIIPANEPSKVPVKPKAVKAVA